MKVFRVLKKIVITIVGVLFFSFAITMTVLLLNYNKYGVSQFGEMSLIIIKDDVSNEKYQKGDLVFVKAKKLDKIELGDELFVYKVHSDGSVDLHIGDVGEIHFEDEAVSFENGAPYSMKYVVGEATTVYNSIGSYLRFFQSKWGFLFTILVPNFLIFVYEFYALVYEIKYGKDKE